MPQLLHSLIQAIQPLLVPFCFVSAWAIVLMLVWSLWSAMRETIAQSRQMHQIPCAQCQFFTRDYHLKCTVHPKRALSEAAIDCLDYESIAPTYPIASEHPYH